MWEIEPLPKLYKVTKYFEKDRKSERRLVNFQISLIHSIRPWQISE